jgi:hypothetical protein
MISPTCNWRGNWKVDYKRIFFIKEVPPERGGFVDEHVFMIF